MNLRDLRYICAVAEHQHFGKAADACHVSQPTLSGQVRKLEDYLGVALFERTTKSVHLTAAGAQVVAAARRCLAGADEVASIAAACRDGSAGALNLGLIPTIAPYLIPLLVTPLRRHFPKLQPVFSEAITDTVLARLEAGELDAAIIATAVEPTRLQTLALYDEPFWLAAPKDHELADTTGPDEPVDPTTLDPSDLLLLTDGHCFRDQALAVCATDPADDQATMRATSLETIINLVAGGQGLTLVPALALRRVWDSGPGLITRPLAPESAKRTVQLVYRTGYPREPLLEEIAGLIRSTVPDSVQAL